MKNAWLAAVAMVVWIGMAHADPPFAGTVWIDPDIITSDDPTTFQSLNYRGLRRRKVYIRVEDRWRYVRVHLFVAIYRANRHTEKVLKTGIWVNAEHFPDTDTAHSYGALFAEMLGRLPAVLRTCVKVIAIHEGPGALGGNDSHNRISMHTDRLNDHRRPFLEESMVHEAGHACESEIRDRPSRRKWRKARAADEGFISDYARDHPLREDFAESILNWIALRYRPDRVNAKYREATVAAIPNRLAYLDGRISVEAMYPMRRP